MYVLYHICTVKGVKCMYESLSLSLSLSAVMRIRAWKRSLGSLYRSEAPHSSTASAFANAATKNSPICSPQQWHHSHFSSSSPLCCFSRTLRAFSLQTSDLEFEGESHLRDLCKVGENKLHNTSDSECRDLETEWSSEEEVIGAEQDSVVPGDDTYTINRKKFTTRNISVVYGDECCNINRDKVMDRQMSMICDDDSNAIGRDNVSEEMEDADISGVGIETMPLDIETDIKQCNSKVSGDNAPGVDIKIEMLPRVMIVGRPNVGKSALFNRLTKRREALVYNTPDGHVTRDIREGVAKIGDLRFVACDTAGLETEADPDSVLIRTAGLTSSALAQCHLVLFLLDGRAGVQPLDTEVGKWLRKQNIHIPIILVVNKAEGLHTDATGILHATLGEAHALAFGDPLAISAETGEGLTDLYDTLRPLLEQAQEYINNTKEPSPDETSEGALLPLQLAIAGRPNVGKSTILNSLLREERVLTGPEPGLTRDAVRVKFTYNNRTVYLVDTAGWMQRAQVKEGPAALSAMHARRSLMRSNIVVLVLDGNEVAKARKSMLQSEVALARWVTQEGRGLVVVVNKMDLLKGKEQAELRNKVMKAVPEEVNAVLPQVEGIPIIFVSAIEGKGRAAIMRKVFESYERWNARLPTARLNNWLQKVLSRHPRKGEGGYGAKMRYITQVKARPPTFVVFITGAGDVDETDLRFVASALREDFNLGGIPIRVIPRHSKRGDKGCENKVSKTKRQPSVKKSQGSQLPSLKRNVVE